MVSSSYGAGPPDEDTSWTACSAATTTEIIFTQHLLLPFFINNMLE